MWNINSNTDCSIHVAKVLLSCHAGIILYFGISCMYLLYSIRYRLKSGSAQYGGRLSR